jgi:hypothetical protein
VKPEAQPQLRQAISELQILYAKHAGEGATGEAGEEEPATGGDEGEGAGKKADSPLWTPPGSGDG